MNVHLEVCNQSSQRWLYRRPGLVTVAESACRRVGLEGEVEISLLFCDDRVIRDLNSRYRGQNAATDVLAFGQEDMPRTGQFVVLGDIVVSLETVARRNAANFEGMLQARARMRSEVRLLFCHGLLHLLGYDHRSAQERERMAAEQAALLRIPIEEAWIGGAA